MSCDHSAAGECHQHGVRADDRAQVFQTVQHTGFPRCQVMLHSSCIALDQKFSCSRLVYLF